MNDLIITLTVPSDIFSIYFKGLQRLQSSLHRDKGMGTTNMAVLYMALVVSCLFFNYPVINKIGHKWAMFLGFLGNIIWMAADGVGRWVIIMH